MATAKSPSNKMRAAALTLLWLAASFAASDARDDEREHRKGVRHGRRRHGSHSGISRSSGGTWWSLWRRRQGLGPRGSARLRSVLSLASVGYLIGRRRPFYFFASSDSTLHPEVSNQLFFSSIRSR